jgi:hypothetical protein
MNTASQPKNRYKWLKFGIAWGTVMVLIVGVFEPMYFGEPITTASLMHDTLLWVSGGLVLGAVMHFVTSRQKKNDHT